MKELVGLDPATWLAQLGVRPTGPISVVSSDLASTVLMEADEVFRVGDARPWLVQLEFQAGRDARLVPRMHLYSTLLERRHRLPVQTLLVLLRPQADARSLNGIYERRVPHGDTYLTFRYGVVRIWQFSIEAILAGPLATLPLAPLVGLPDRDVAPVLRRIEARVREEAAPAVAEQVRVGTYLLLGLRFPQDVIDDLLRGVGIMAGALKESSTYQKIWGEGLAEGRALGRVEGRVKSLAANRETLLRIGGRRFGPASADTLAALARMDDPDQVLQLIERLVEASSWDDLGLEKLTP